MTDEGRQCCYCIRAEMQPQNGSIHNHLCSDSQLLVTVETHYEARLDVGFRFAGTVAQVQVL